METTCRVTSSLPSSRTSLRCFSPISHGQASVERGYSVNKDMLIENLHEKALCTVHDSISTLEDHFTKLPLTPAMKRHVMSARMRYGQYLDEQKKESLNEQQRKKRKGVQLSIREAERKKSKVDTSIDILGKEADDLAKSAEAKHDFTLLTKSNALRLKVVQQSQETPKRAPNDAAYKRWSCHSEPKLLCKLCRTSPPPALGARFTVFWACRPCGPAGWLALLLAKAG